MTILPNGLNICTTRLLVWFSMIRGLQIWFLRIVLARTHLTFLDGDPASCVSGSCEVLHISHAFHAFRVSHELTTCHHITR